MSHAPSLYLAGKYESRFALLAAFDEQFARAWEGEFGAGRVNPPRAQGQAALHLFFNNPQSPASLHEWLGPVLGPRAVFQWCVDHPLTIPPDHLDRFTHIPGFRLLTVADDDGHLLPLRFPSIQHARIMHGVDEGACCDLTASDTTRDIDILVTGSVASEGDLRTLREYVPSRLVSRAEEIANLRTEHPHLSFGQAWDIAGPRSVHAGDHWLALCAVFRYSTALTNRARRAALLRALREHPTTVLGNDAVGEFCEGKVRRVGEVAYAELPAWFARAKVAIALGPTQFTHAFSERLLLSLAGGSATIADDRLLVRREFHDSTSCVELFPARHPEACVGVVRSLLADAGRRRAMASSGQSVVRERHLWRHRAVEIATLAGDAMRAPAPWAVSA